MPQENGVRTQHPEYIDKAETWQRCRDAAEGERAVHAAGIAYLPKLASEKDKDYAARRDRTPFFNATWRTIAGLSGMLLRKSPDLEAPPALEDLLEDVDRAGTPLHSFVSDLLTESLTVGRVGVLADYPEQAAEPGITVAQAVTLGLRPSLQKYTAESIINWATERIGNSMVLSMVVLAEEVSIPGDTEFERKSETRYRVCDLSQGQYRQRIYRIDDHGGDELMSEVTPLMNGAPLAFIPFVFISVDSTGPQVEDPPLIDLVDMNLHHYQVSADYEHGCHFSGLPTLFISGYTPDQTDSPIYIGGPSANCLPMPESRAYFVETSSNFSALRANLDDKTQAMAVLGARMLEAQQRKVETAETVSQHRKGEESLLSNMAQTASLGVTRALNWFAQWAGVQVDVSYEINRDFAPAGMTSADMTALVSAWQAGAISQEVMFDRFQAAEVIAEDVTFEEEQARISSEAPKLMTNAGPDASTQP